MPHSEGMDLWLRGRGTIQVAAQVKFRETRYSWEIEKQINTMLGQYEELFRFAWPDEWKKSVKIPFHTTHGYANLPDYQGKCRWDTLRPDLSQHPPTIIFAV